MGNRVKQWKRNQLPRRYAKCPKCGTYIPCRETAIMAYCATCQEVIQMIPNREEQD